MAARDQFYPDVAMTDTPMHDPLAGISENEKFELLSILQERRQRATSHASPNTQETFAPAVNPTIPTTRAALPKWNGKAEDFGFYIQRLEARIRKEWAPCVDPCSICLDMIDTLPYEKQP